MPESRFNLLTFCVYAIVRLLTSVILVTDVADDMISRMCKCFAKESSQCMLLTCAPVVIFEFPWQFGYGAFALYLVGIAQTLADVSYQRDLSAF